MDLGYQKKLGFSFAKAATLEWLETNGLGGYASSTVPNAHTRKYHGLLVTKVNNLPDKYVLLSKLEDLLIVNGQEHYLTAHHYPNYIEPGSFDNLQEFKLTTHPVWQYQFGTTTITKEILMPYGENSVLIKFTVNEVIAGLQLQLRPFFAMRNFHQLMRENHNIQQQVTVAASGFTFTPYQDMPTLLLQTSTAMGFLDQPLWYRNFIYEEERKRGYDYQEDLFTPGIITLDFSQHQEIIVACTIETQLDDLTTKWQLEIARREQANSQESNQLRKYLHNSGKSFLIHDSILNTNAITAGYHWFLEWGRDTMIALPGLTLFSGQEATAVRILQTFAQNEYQGLIPNCLGTTKEQNAYNSVDASLWFCWAVQQYYLHTHDIQTVAQHFWPTLKNILHWFQQGTLHDIKTQSNGLLYAGNPKINVTWMDAVVDGQPVTPRYGLQVEVNALWFNMLKFMLELAGILEDPVRVTIKALALNTEKAFREVFWCAEKGYLHDFVNSAEKNSALRPNQIFAVSLPYSPLLAHMAVRTVQAVKEKLLTPYGLRTLAPNEPNYVGNYQGDQRSRDYAYHNGTVWPWLLGHFAEALLKVTSDRRKVTTVLQPCVESLQIHLLEYGIGTISEVFSGDPPHQPNGCISQAWSVAEVLRLTYILNLEK